MRLSPIGDLGPKHVEGPLSHLSLEHGHTALEFFQPPGPPASKGGPVFIYPQGLDALRSTLQPEDRTPGEVDDE